MSAVFRAFVVLVFAVLTQWSAAQSTCTDSIKGTLNSDFDTVCGSSVVHFTFQPPAGANYHYAWYGFSSTKDSIGNSAAVNTTTTFTLSVTSAKDPNCSKTFVKTIYFKAPPEAGTSSTLTLCNTNSPLNLFQKLGSTADAGGFWKDPQNHNFSNPLNPASAVSGTYTYYTSTTGCPADSAKVQVQINNFISAGLDGSIILCNNTGNVNLFNYISNEPGGGNWFGPAVNSSNGALNTNVLSPGNYTYGYFTSPAAPCLSDTAFAQIQLRSLPTATPGSLPPICEGNANQLPIRFTGVGPFTVNYLEGIEAKIASGLAANDYLNVSPSINTSYTITSVADKGTPACTSYVRSSVQVNVFQPATASLDSVVCDAIGATYQVYLTLSGGHQNSYKINGSQVTGTRFSSGPLPYSAPFSYTLTDRNGCLPISKVSGTKNCNCNSDAGTMNPSLIITCGDQPAYATGKNNQFVDGNDVVNYILHDSYGQNLGNILAINKTANSFIASAIPGLIYGKRYYISRVIGDPDSSDVTAVDLNNNCVSIAAGQPVIFNSVPNLNASFASSQICLGDTARMNFDFNAGRQVYRLSFSNGWIMNGLSPMNNQRLISPNVVGTSNYTIVEVKDTTGCIAQVNIPLSLTVVDAPDTSAVQLTCNNSNNAYTVSFDIIGGDPSSYSVNSLASGARFTSSLIPSGRPYDLRVSDKNNCNDIILNGTHTCPCISKAGSMVSASTIPVEFCVTANASAQHNGQQVLDGNDVLSFLLSSDPNDPISSMIEHSSSPSFGFIAGMTPGLVYYICPIAGDNDGNGLVNLNSTCKEFAAGAPIRFIALPQASVSGSTHACQGDSVVLSFNAVGNGTVRFVVRGSDNTSYSLAGNGTLTQKILPNINSGIVNYSLDPGIYDNTNPQNCLGSWNNSPVSITVHPTPLASLIGNFDICKGESVTIPLVLAGNDTLTAQISGPGYSAVLNKLAGNYNHVITPDTAGLYLYSFTSVKDKTPAGCAGNVSGQARVLVRELPTAILDVLDNEICREESSGPRLTVSGSTAVTVYYRDNQGNQYQKTGLPNGTVSYPFVPSSTVSFKLDSVTDLANSTTSKRSCISKYPGSSFQQILVHQLPVGVLSGDTEICHGQQTKLIFNFQGSPGDSPKLKYTYSQRTGNSNSLHLDSAITLHDTLNITPYDSSFYQLLSVADRFGCVAQNRGGTAQIMVNPIPVPGIQVSQRSSCPPLQTQLKNSSSGPPIGSYTWHFGDGTQLSGTGTPDSLLHIYNNPGSYSLRLEVSSPQGCYKDIKLDNYLTVFDVPTADFVVEEKEMTILDPELRFTNTSFGDHELWWSVFDLQGKTIATTKDENPAIVFPSEDTATYTIWLKVQSGNGCLDSTSKSVSFLGAFEVYVPNSFTPDGDGINDVFVPVTLGESFENYDLTIYNRWGELMFHTRDPKEGWNGTFNLEPCGTGNYTYVLRTKSKYSGEVRVARGVIGIL